MKRLAIYCVETGDKTDFSGFNVAPSDAYDLILLTDRPRSHPGVDVRQFDTRGLEPSRSSRRPKLMPHEYLGDYEWSLYIDGNAQLKQNPMDLLEPCFTSGNAFYSFRHPWRDCIYEEAEVVVEQGYDDERRIREQLDRYESLGYPRHNGLIAGTVLLRRHGDAEVAALGREWFENVLRYSKRDQLAFNFVAWRRQFQNAYFDSALLDNPYILWPKQPRDRRVTADFDADVYAWLNPDVATSGLSPEQHFLRARQAGDTPQYKRHNWRLRRIANALKSGTGDIYYNAHNYADIYEMLIGADREKPIKLLQIGVSDRGTETAAPSRRRDAAIANLRMWRRFLPAAQIYSIDTADLATAGGLDGITPVRGDVTSPADIARLLDAAGGAFDYIVDSGSHAAHYQQAALAHLFAHLKRGGRYFIEDLHRKPAASETWTGRKTRDVLQALRHGIMLPTRYLDDAALASIHEDLDKLQFYDSAERSLGRVNADALAVLTKVGRGKRDRTPLRTRGRERARRLRSAVRRLLRRARLL